MDRIGRKCETGHPPLLPSSTPRRTTSFTVYRAARPAFPRGEMGAAVRDMLRPLEVSGEEACSRGHAFVKRRDSSASPLNEEIVVSLRRGVEMGVA